MKYVEQEINDMISNMKKYGCRDTDLTKLLTMIIKYGEEKFEEGYDEGYDEGRSLEFYET